MQNRRASLDHNITNTHSDFNASNRAFASPASGVGAATLLSRPFNHLPCIIANYHTTKALELPCFLVTLQSSLRKSRGDGHHDSGISAQEGLHDASILSNRASTLFRALQSPFLFKRSTILLEQMLLRLP